MHTLIYAVCPHVEHFDFPAVMFPSVSVEATPSYFVNIMRGDSKIPNNWDALKAEPKYTLAHTLYAINPNTKLLVSLRNPTER